MAQLADLIRKKYPGQYDDLDDDTLEKSVLAKHPEYQDLVKKTTPVADKSVDKPVTAAIKPSSSSDVPFNGSPRFSTDNSSDEPTHEPDTYWGGFRKGLGDYIKDATSGIMPALESAANPKTTGDLLSLILPSEMPMVAKGGLSNIADRVAGNAPAAESAIRDVAPAQSTGKLEDISKAIAAPVTEQPRPPGPWDANAEPAKTLGGVTEDTVYNIARDKFNMGRDNPDLLAKETASTDKPEKSFDEMLDSFGGNGHPDSPDYTNRVLGSVEAKGEPGLQVEGDNVVYRNIKGEPVGVAKLATDKDGNKLVMDLAVDKSKGMLSGRAATRIANKLNELGATESAGTISDDATNLKNRMTAKASSGKPTAEFLGLNQDGSPLFNIAGGPNDKSTVGLDKLKELGIEAPEVPADAKPIKGDELRKIQQQKRSASMDAKNKGFKGTVPDDSTDGNSPILYHGTRANFTNFEPTKGGSGFGNFNKWTSFTENPEYAKLYSEGKFGDMKRNMSMAGNPRIISANVKAKNILDLTKPLSNDDINKFYTAYERINPGKQISHSSNPQFIFDLARQNYESLPYDAVKFNEHGQVNWAVSPKVEINQTNTIDVKPTKVEDSSDPIRQSLMSETGEVGSAVKPNEIPPGVDQKTAATLARNNQIGKMANLSQKKSLWGEIRDANRAALTAYDFSAAGRQGKPLLLTKAYWNSFDDMFKAWGSENAYKNVMESINEHPNFQQQKYQVVNKNGKLINKVGSLAERAGLSIGDAEQFNSNVAEKYLPGVRRSERAYNAFLNKLRADHFNTMISDAREMGLNPDKNNVVLKQIGSFINDATGRGSLGKLEKAAPVLNEAFFAPRLMASRVNMFKRWLNPATYRSANTAVRQQAIKSLLAVTGFGMGIGALGSLAGGKVSTDYDSSDFGKVKIGNTRIDPYSGFQQYAVGAARLLSGRSASSTSGKSFDLTNPKFGQPSRASVVGQFAQNKLAPVPSLVWSWMQGKDWDGKPFSLKNALLQRTVPIVMQDLYDIWKEDPKKLPPGIFSASPTATKVGLSALPMMGEGIQTYGR